MRTPRKPWTARQSRPIDRPDTRAMALLRKRVETIPGLTRKEAAELLSVLQVSHKEM